MYLKAAKILCVFMLAGGIIFPAHAYTHDIEKAAEHTFLDNQDQQENVQSVCDHCCHISAHTLGITQIKPVCFITKTDQSVNSKIQYYSSRSTSPPYHPPIV